MSREGLLFAVLGCAACSGLWAAIDFRQTQERGFNRAVGERSCFQQENQSLRENLTFLESHQKDIDFLNEKGWFFPKNRLIAREFLEDLRPLLKEVSYQFDPEAVKELKDNVSLKVTQISFETMSILDVEVYAFIENLLNQFPGVLILRDLILRRQEGEPHSIQGTVVVDWVAMEGKS